MPTALDLRTIDRFHRPIDGQTVYDPGGLRLSSKVERPRVHIVETQLRRLNRRSFAVIGQLGLDCIGRPGAGQIKDLACGQRPVVHCDLIDPADPVVSPAVRSDK